MINSIIKYDDNTVFWNESNILKQGNSFEPGVYDIVMDNYGKITNLKYREIKNSFKLMPSPQLKNIQEYVDIFLSDKYKKTCEDANILYKGGLLLYGKEGLGKSNYINSVILQCIKEKNAIVFNVHNAATYYALIGIIKDFRMIQDTLFIIVMEEIDQFLGYSGFESSLKNFMDGIDSIENILFLSTTNYFHLIPNALLRPSRFKKVFEIVPSEDVEEMKIWLKDFYISIIPDITQEQCDDLNDICLNKTVDEMKHAILDFKMNISKIPEKKSSIGFRNR